MISQRTVTAALTAALALFCLATVTLLADTDWHHYADSATYLRTAQSLAAGEGYTYQGEAYSLRPPGLAWLLSFVVDRPFDPRDCLDVNLVIQVSAVAMLLCLCLALRRLHGTPSALLVTLMFACNPITLGGFNSVFSEFPHLALFFGGAWLLLPDRETGTSVSFGRGLLGALLLGASLWFRPVALAVLPCLFLLKHGKGRLRHGLGHGLLVLVLVLPWMLHARAVMADAPRPATQRVAFSNLNGMFHEDARDPDSPRLSADAWLERLQRNLSDVTAGLDYAFLGGDKVWARVQEADRRQVRTAETRPAAMILAGLMACCMLFSCIKRGSLLDGYMLLYTVIILLWFTFVHRMLLPVLPLAMSSVVFTIEYLVARCVRLAEQPRTLATALGLLALTALWPLHVGWSDWSAGIGVDRRQRQISRVERDTAEWLREHTAPDASILHVKSTVIGLLSDRRCYTWRHLPRQWPEDCPPADWAVYGPENAYPEVHQAIAERGQLHTTLKAKLQGRDSEVRIYRLGGG